MKTNDLLSKLDRCPPFVCYYAAHRNRGKRPTLREMVDQSGMSQRTFVRIAHKTSWTGITVIRMSQFAAACGIDVLDPQPVMEWLAVRIASGHLSVDLGGCRGQGERMVERLNLLSARAVMEQEKPATA